MRLLFGNRPVSFPPRDYTVVALKDRVGNAYFLSRGRCYTYETWSHVHTCHEFVLCVKGGLGGEA